jgi:phosphatidylserine/phosphatidylglycerophosphate/cardiolipin synthase-like enzyme
MKKVVCFFLFFSLLSAFNPPRSTGLPAEDIRVVVDAQYFRVARQMIQDAKSSIRVMMFEIGYYENHRDTPSNLLVKELIEAKKRGIRVEVILEIREGDDRTTKRNRQSGKILSDGGVEVIYDSLFKTTHSKLMVVDGELTLLGSTNWVFSSLTNNHEVSVLIRSKEAAKELIDYFNQVKAAGSKK